MIYLVVGGSGYLGSHIVEQLIANNHQVYIFDNNSGNLKNQIIGKTTYIFGDITKESDFDQLDNHPNFDGVFHLAAKKSVSESFINPMLYENVNILGTQNLLNYCKKSQITNIVFTSSAAVYGQYDSKSPISESSSANPINPYGMTKLHGENIIETAVNSGSISGFSLRVFNIVGASKPAHFDNKGENVIPIMLRSFLLDNVFTVFGKGLDTKDGSCVRDYVNVTDVARAHVNAMEFLHHSSLRSHRIINISSGSGTSMLELIKTFNSLSDRELNWKYGERRRGDPANVIGGNQLAYDTMGWKAEKSIFQSMNESLDTIPKD